jgi:hypothetical protein
MVSVFCAEAEQSRVSRRWLLDYAVSRNAVLFTAHFPESAAGVVARRDDGFTWKYLQLILNQYMPEAVVQPSD